MTAPGRHIQSRIGQALRQPPRTQGRNPHSVGDGACQPAAGDQPQPVSESHGEPGGALGQSSMIAAWYRSLIRPRLPNGTPSRSNSSRSQPTPKAAVMRPLLSQSAVPRERREYTFADLLTVKQVAAELERDTPLRVVLRTLVAERQGQLQLDFNARHAPRRNSSIPTSFRSTALAARAGSSTS